MRRFLQLSKWSIRSISNIINAQIVPFVTVSHPIWSNPWHSSSCHEESTGPEQIVEMFEAQASVGGGAAVRVWALQRFGSVCGCVVFQVLLMVLAKEKHLVPFNDSKTKRRFVVIEADDDFWWILKRQVKDWWGRETKGLCFACGFRWFNCDQLNQMSCMLYAPFAYYHQFRTTAAYYPSLCLIVSNSCQSFRRILDMMQEWCVWKMRLWESWWVRSQWAFGCGCLVSTLTFPKSQTDPRCVNMLSELVSGMSGGNLSGFSHPTQDLTCVQLLQCLLIC